MGETYEYVFVTRELPAAHVLDHVQATVKSVPLVWRDITDDTQDPRLRGVRPGRYALCRELSRVYVLAQRG